MKIRDIVCEGGWDTTLTQGTVLHPRVVGVALKIVDRFVMDFNEFLKQHGLGPVRRGTPRAQVLTTKSTRLKTPIRSTETLIYR